MDQDLQNWADLLESLSAGRWRSVPLRVRDLLPSPTRPTAAVGCGTSGSSPRLPPIDAAWRLADSFAQSIDRSLGRFCTPRPVARELATRTLGPEPPDAVFDPACGGGALILGALEAAQSAGRDVKVHAADLDPQAVAICQAAVWLAVGMPDQPPGEFSQRDFLAHGSPEGVPPTASILVNPPWGTAPVEGAIEAWNRRTGRLGDALAGELNVYTAFLAQLALRSPSRVGLITPIHWFHRHSLSRLRELLARSGRLEQALVLRKRVFKRAPDMIPALTVWSASHPERSIRVDRAGLGAQLPLPFPIPVESRAQVSLEEWLEMPDRVFPLLRSRSLAAAGRRFATALPKLGDPSQPRGQRLFHCGDGIYKTRIKDESKDCAPGWPLLTRAAQTGRYRLGSAKLWIRPTFVDRLSPRDKDRFTRPLLLVHALKKANAPWRLATAIHCGEAPLAVTNNFLVLSPQHFEGDLHYPLTLLNSRLYSRIYTEHFPGVNIEAHTLGAMPLPWPVGPDSGTGAPRAEAHTEAFRRWGAVAIHDDGSVAGDVYRWLCRAGRALVASNPTARRPGHSANSLAEDSLDQRVEAVVCGMWGVAKGSVT